MISIHPRLNLNTFVAVSLVATGLGFLLIVGVGFGLGHAVTSDLVNNTPNQTASSSEKWGTTTSTSGSAPLVATNPSSAPTTNNPSTAPSPTTPSSSGAKTPSSTPPAPTPTPSPTPAPTPTPSPTPAPTYCSGQTPCYGRSDLSGHSSAGGCWGYIGNIMYNVSSLANSHSGGKSTITDTCGNNIGAALSDAPNNSKHTSALQNKAGSTLWSYKIGYYDATKP